MSAETNFTNDPEKLRHEFEWLQPVLLVAEERAQVGYSSTYDRFMFDYFGHPATEDYKSVIRPDDPQSGTTYPHRVTDQFTQEGTLVLLRSCQLSPTERPEDYILVIADLTARQISLHAIAEIAENRNAGRRKEFIYTAPLTSVQPAPELSIVPQPLTDPVRIVLDGWRKARAQAEVLASRPRIVLGTEYRAIHKPDGRSELFAGNIGELDKGLRKLEAALSMEQEATIVAA